MVNILPNPHRRDIMSIPIFDSVAVVRRYQSTLFSFAIDGCEQVEILKNNTKHIYIGGTKIVALARFHSVIVMFYSSFLLSYIFSCITFDYWFFPSFVLIYLSVKYILCVVVWSSPPIISQFYISLLPTRNDGVQYQFQNYPNNIYSYRVYIVVYCCSLYHFGISFLSNPNLFHTFISIHPPDPTPHLSYQVLSNVMYIVILIY